jgi:hypothetical protein
MQTKKKKLSIAALCLASLLVGYAIAEYIHSINMTGTISYDVTLSVVWVSTGEPVLTYSWGDMRDQAKNSPDIKITNVGEYSCNVVWSTSDLPSALVLSAWRYDTNNDWASGIQMTLGIGEFETVRFRLTDAGQPPGDFSFNLNLQSQPNV